MTLAESELVASVKSCDPATISGIPPVQLSAFVAATILPSTPPPASSSIESFSSSATPRRTATGTSIDGIIALTLMSLFILYVLLFRNRIHERRQDGPPMPAQTQHQRVQSAMQIEHQENGSEHKAHPAEDAGRLPGSEASRAAASSTASPAHVQPLGPGTDSDHENHGGDITRKTRHNRGSSDWDDDVNVQFKDNAELD